MADFARGSCLKVIFGAENNLWWSINLKSCGVTGVRVIFPRKGPVNTAPFVEGGSIDLYHGTILPALYKILGSLKFGSKAGRHKYAWERLGNFYVTLDEGIVEEYAWEAACDPYYFRDAEKFLKISLSEKDISIDRLMRKFDARDLYDLYIKIASYVRYHGIVQEESIYPQVIIKLTVRSPSVVAELHCLFYILTGWRLGSCKDPLYSLQIPGDLANLVASSSTSSREIEMGRNPS